ncbi:MAG: murein L,D-transpeptidase [Rubrimonas sp.]|uniref:L,D-transpeptidase family protein n=1 Tax=Rubrimonas sp. TaxID=2036015 RepID=UPI002FDE70DD
MASTGALAQALAVRLEGASGPEARFYAARDHAPLWLDGDGAAADAFLAALEGADAHALPVARHAPDALRRAREAAAAPAATPAERAQAELAFARAYLAYATDLSAGVVDPRSVAAEIRRAAPRRDPLRLLEAAAQAADMPAHLAGLAPTDPDYARLLALYAELRDAARGGAWGAPIPPGRTLRPGDRDPRTPALRARLERLGDLPAGGGVADPDRYDADLAEALRRFQRRHGLDADAAMGPLTRAALNAGPAERAAQVAVNLERIRWMNFDLGARRIEVNQAAFTVRLIDSDRALFEERVVVGTQRDQTPEFSDEMEYMVLNPSWHVPESIAVDEILPLLQRDPGYLAARNMKLTRVDGQPGPEDPASHDFTNYSAANFPYRIRQRPDAGNALGKVKFMFPNDYAIYLHDTPSKRLFDRDTRAFSHGCVRVRDPLRLAELLLAPQMEDPSRFIQRVLSAGAERYVTLDAHVPVHLLYRTVTFDAAGTPEFRADVYGRDARASQALRKAGVALPDL